MSQERPREEVGCLVSYKIAVCYALYFSPLGAEEELSFALLYFLCERGRTVVFSSLEGREEMCIFSLKGGSIVFSSGVDTHALPCIFRLLCCQAREREVSLVYSTPAGRLDWHVPALHACYCRTISVGALTLRIPLPAAGRQLTGKKRLLTGLEFKRLNESYNMNQTSTLYLLDYKVKNKLSMHTKHAG